jgi:thiamine pyrophosphokinase
LSSHHIVRDDQEPALIIANGSACNLELLGQLEWSPLVIVLDWQWNVMKLDIKVDVLLGDFDGDFDPSYYKEKQYPLEIVHTQIKTKQILRKLLTICMKEKYLL